MVSVLREALAGVWEPVRTSFRADEAYSEVERLSSRITRDYLGRYEHAADHFTTYLGDERKFKLRAAWKRREIVQHSRAMAEGMSRTITERRASLEAKLERNLTVAREKRAAGKEAPTLREIRAESAQEWHKWLQYKQRQLDGILQARAQLEAQTDILVHSGLANPLKDRIMFFGGSPAPCSRCVAVQGGNPYTIAQARSIGGVVHPSCRDHWQEWAPVGVDLEKLPTMQQQWRVARAPLDVGRQRVRDGSVTLWDGRPVTPARGWAKDKEAGLRQMRDPWKRIPGRVETMQQKNAQVSK